MVRVEANGPIVEAGDAAGLSDPNGRRIKLDALYYAFIEGDWKLVLIGLEVPNGWPHPERDQAVAATARVSLDWQIRTE